MIDGVDITCREVCSPIFLSQNATNRASVVAIEDTSEGNEHAWENQYLKGQFSLRLLTDNDGRHGRAGHIFRLLQCDPHSEDEVVGSWYRAVGWISVVAVE